MYWHGYPCASTRLLSPSGLSPTQTTLVPGGGFQAGRIGASVPVVGLTRGGGTEQHPLGRVGQVLIHVVRPMRPHRKLSWEETVRTSRRNKVGELLGTSSC